MRRVVAYNGCMVERDTDSGPAGKEKETSASGAGAQASDERVAIAEGFISMKPATVQMVLDQRNVQGNVLDIAKAAAMATVKNASQIMPLCQPVRLNRAEVNFIPAEDGLRCVAEIHAVSKTGMEMEALMAVQAVLATVYDMCKATQGDMTIGKIKLLRGEDESHGE